MYTLLTEKILIHPSLLQNDPLQNFVQEETLQKKILTNVITFALQMKLNVKFLFY